MWPGLYPKVEITHVNTRLHTADIMWNLELRLKIKTSRYILLHQICLFGVGSSQSYKASQYHRKPALVHCSSWFTILNAGLLRDEISTEMFSCWKSSCFSSTLLWIFQHPTIIELCFNSQYSWLGVSNELICSTRTYRHWKIQKLFNKLWCSTLPLIC